MERSVVTSDVRSVSDSVLTRPVGRRGFLSGIAGAGALALGAPLLSACGSSAKSTGSGSGGGGSKTLTLMLASWVDQGFLSDVMQGSAAASIGAKLKIVTVDDGTYPAQAAAAQKSGNAPDVIFWTAQGIPALQAGGVKLQALDSYVSKEDKSAFYTQDYAANTIDGKLYGLGFRCNCRGIVYRGDYAEAAGATAPDSWSFDEFGQFATKLNANGHTGFAYEAKTGDGRASSNFLPVLWSTGAALVTGGAGAWKIGFTPEQMTTVMKFYYDAVHTWKSTPAAVGTWGYDTTDGNFAKGSLASYSAGPFVYPNSKNYPKTLQNLKVAPIPNAGKQATFWEEHSLFVHGDSKQQDLAFSFIEAMRSEATQKLIAGRTGDAQLAVRKSVNASISDPFIKSFGTLLDNAVVPEAIGIAPIMNNAVLPAIQSVSLKNTAPADAAKALMSNMQTQLDLINKAG